MNGQAEQARRVLCAIREYLPIMGCGVELHPLTPVGILVDATVGLDNPAGVVDTMGPWIHLLDLTVTRGDRFVVAVGFAGQKEPALFATWADPSECEARITWAIQAAGGVNRLWICLVPDDIGVRLRQLFAEVAPTAH